MDPPEVPEWCVGGTRPQQLVFLAGLSPTTSATHAAILNGFLAQPRSQDRPPLRMRLVSGDIEAAHEKTPKTPRGILRREWPLKYLNQVPATIVQFADLDWDNAEWASKKVELDSKLRSLRDSVGAQGGKLAVVLLQALKTKAMKAVQERAPAPGSAPDPLAQDRAKELCEQCQLSSKQLFVVPVGGADLMGYILKLELAFHELAQAFYQGKLKAIRARSIPNNSPALVVRQLFKLGFISELRQDTHTALRNYKLAYEKCRDDQEVWEAADVYEWRAVAGLLNYKMCELSFLHCTASEACAQMRRFMTSFFGRSSAIGGTVYTPWGAFLNATTPPPLPTPSHPLAYPTPTLAAIEFALWRSKQCWQFAEVFDRAVTNGLAAVVTQNPGVHLDQAAMHYAMANSLISMALKGESVDPNVPLRRIGGAYPSPDPLSHTPFFYGQRPWRVAVPDGSSAPASVEADAVEAMLVSDSREKRTFQQRLRVNHEGVLALQQAAAAQYKRYQCPRQQMRVMAQMAGEYAALGAHDKALAVAPLILLDGNSLSPLGTKLKFKQQLLVRRTILRGALASSVAIAAAKDWLWAALQLLSIDCNDGESVLETKAVVEAWNSVRVSLSERTLKVRHGGLPLATMSPELATAWKGALTPRIVLNASRWTDCPLRVTTAFLSDRFVSGEEQPFGLREQGVATVGSRVWVLLTLRSTDGWLKNTGYDLELRSVRVLVDVVGRKPDDPPLATLLSEDARVLAKSVDGVRRLLFPLQLDNKFTETATLVRVSVELASAVGNSSPLATLEWDGLSTSVEADVQRTPLRRPLGFSSLRLSAAPSAIELPDLGDHEVRCLRGEIATASFFVKNRDKAPIHNLVLESTTTTTAQPNAILFLNERTELSSDLKQTAAPSLPAGEQTEVRVRLSAQLVDSVSVPLQLTYSPEAARDQRRTVPLSLTVHSEEPFEFKTRVLSLDGLPVHSLLNRNTHVLQMELEAHAPMRILKTEWLLSDFLHVVDDSCGGPSNSDEVEELEEGDVISYAVVADVNGSSELEDTDCPLGRLAVEWIRVVSPAQQAKGVSAVPVRSILALGPTNRRLAACPVAIDVALKTSKPQVREAIHVEVTLHSHHDELLELNLEFDALEAFMYAGDKKHIVRLMPDETVRLPFVLMALTAGRLPFPRLGVHCAQLDDGKLAKVLRALPATLFVLPSGKC